MAVVAVIVILLVLAALRWGTDSRDGRDWARGQIDRGVGSRDMVARCC